MRAGLSWRRFCLLVGGLSDASVWRARASKEPEDIPRENTAEWQSITAQLRA
jgi:hypothetical protein